MTRADQSSRWIRRIYSSGTTLTPTGRRANHPITIAILARDEERCIARCLDSVVGHGFDVLVVDTGSADSTPDIVAGYRDRGVGLLRFPWPDSFAEVRNFAIDSVGAGWVVFVDADEWLTERAAADLADCLESLSDLEELGRLVFAPKIFEVDRGVHHDSIPRIFQAGGRIRFRGPVHEYPVVAGEPDTAVDLVGVDLEFRHDGYRPAVIEAKGKTARNLALLEVAHARDPGNPRWLYYLIRDGLPVLGRDRVVELCARLEELAGAKAETGGPFGPLRYYGLALSFACQALIMNGDWVTVHRFCDRLDGLRDGTDPDAHYFRSMSDVLHGTATERDLLRTIRLRGDEELVANGSAVDPAGRHLDALIAVLVELFRGTAEAGRYRDLCVPWTDVFFERSVLRSSWAEGTPL